MKVQPEVRLCCLADGGLAWKRESAKVLPARIRREGKQVGELLREGTAQLQGTFQCAKPSTARAQSEQVVGAEVI